MVLPDTKITLETIKDLLIVDSGTKSDAQLDYEVNFSPSYFLKLNSDNIVGFCTSAQKILK